MQAGESCKSNRELLEKSRSVMQRSQNWQPSDKSSRSMAARKAWLAADVQISITESRGYSPKT